jgi:hypothetical protein
MSICKHCGDTITAKNKYAFDVCNKESCKRKRLRVCAEDCFNCTYNDCEVDASKIPNENFGKFRAEYSYEQRQEDLKLGFRKCIGCGIIYPIDNFSHDTRYKDTYNTRCKGCMNKASKKRRKDNGVMWHAKVSGWL